MSGPEGVPPSLVFSCWRGQFLWQMQMQFPGHSMRPPPIGPVCYATGVEFVAHWSKVGGSLQDCGLIRPHLFRKASSCLSHLRRRHSSEEAGNGVAHVRGGSRRKGLVRCRECGCWAHKITGNGRQKKALTTRHQVWAVLCCVGLVKWDRGCAVFQGWSVSLVRSARQSSCCRAGSQQRMPVTKNCDRAARQGRPPTFRASGSRTWSWARVEKRMRPHHDDICIPLDDFSAHPCPLSCRDTSSSLLKAAAQSQPSCCAARTLRFFRRPSRLIAAIASYLAVKPGARHFTCT